MFTSISLTKWTTFTTLMVVLLLPIQALEELTLEEIEAISEDLPAPSAPRDIMTHPNWLPFHKVLSEEAQQWLSSDSGLDLLFLGDSITETWRGTENGLRPCTRCNGVPEVFNKEYGHLNAAAFGIAGDQTKHLLWRLQNGELPKGLKSKVVVVLIGTNDLGQWPRQSKEETSEGVQEVVRHVRHTMPDSQVVVMGILPRSRIRHTATAKTLPIRTNITWVNNDLKNQLNDYANVHFLDCWYDFLDTQQAFVVRNLMPDFLHLSDGGHRVWAKCLRPTLSQWLPFDGNAPSEHSGEDEPFRDEL